MDIVSFSRTSEGARLFFPNHVELSDIRVRGRKQGVRLIRIPNPHHYELDRPGGYDGARLKANCTLVAQAVQLEKMTPKYPGDTDKVHLLIGGKNGTKYADQMSLFPEIRFTDCDDISVYLKDCVASLFFDRCSMNTVTAQNVRGELVFRDCQFQPDVQGVSGDLYTLGSTLGTRFTNCTVHAPIVAGIANPDMVNSTGFLDINKFVRHHHLNTALGNRILQHYRLKGTELNPDFIAMLRSHHARED